VDGYLSGMSTIEQKDGLRFSLMTVNVRFGLADGEGPHRWENRKQAFAPLLTARRPDFIAMQEVNHFQAAYFQSLLPDYGVIGGRTPAPPFWQDVLIFYRRDWRCLKQDRFFLSRTPDVPSRMVDSRWPRQCVMGRFRNDRQDITCVNTHFDFADQVQQQSARIILDRLSGFSPDPAPQLLTGDFNARPGDGCHRLLTEPGDLTADPFVDAFAGGHSGTVHKFTGCPVGDQVDWILWRHGLELSEKKIITDRFDGIYPSDHFPVYAAFVCHL
jgi:endonuclease/exonuclease/phosphatase family metal-dependent hydrolase